MGAPFEIVAHRGVPDQAPENTLPAFNRAIDLGSDAVELDVRLTKDGIPVIYHYFYLPENTGFNGAVFSHSLAELRNVRLVGAGGSSSGIPTLAETLDALAGRVGLEIEIKGPEPEAPDRIAYVLDGFRPYWEMMELTSYEPALLLKMREKCPGIPVDYLFPRSEEWMKLDVVAFAAAHKARLAGARAVHLHPSQIFPEVVDFVRGCGIEVHAWDVNSREALERAAALSIPRVCTDRFSEAAAFRDERNAHEQCA